MFKIVILPTDWVIWLLMLGSVLYGVWVSRLAERRASWVKVFRDTAPLCAAVVYLCFAMLALLDSFHFRRALPAASGTTAGAVAYSPRTESVLDLLLAKPIAMREKSYSAPLALYLFGKETVERPDASISREAPRLEFAGSHLKSSDAHLSDVLLRALGGLMAGAAVSLLGLVAFGWVQGRINPHHRGLHTGMADVWHNNTELPLRAGWLTFTLVAMVACVTVVWMQVYHVLGTDRTGNDVLVQGLKSVRTAFVVGSLSTLAALPFAVVLGVMAGYFKGWVDDVIQYVYTTLSSIPAVLLIAASVLMVQVYLDQHPNLFDTTLERADVRLLAVCMILGLTGWATLCRLIRAETMKLRELDFVQAAIGFGVSPAKVMARHILPNVMHLVLITTVLSFCEYVLYEAVLSYVGVGVDPSMNSFGGMINQARGELSRDPVVWWSFASAFGFMVVLVLAANLFADGVQQAFDPRARTFKVRLDKASVKVSQP